jgi:hypothetical protein
MAKAEKASAAIDPEWAAAHGDHHPVTELAAHFQGNYSPFGEVTFPLEKIPYEHPSTQINK